MQSDTADTATESIDKLWSSNIMYEILWTIVRNVSKTVKENLYVQFYALYSAFAI